MQGTGRVIWLATAVVLFSVGPGAPVGASAGASRGARAAPRVSVVKLRLVDRTRATPKTPEQNAAAQRVLDTVVRFPTDATSPRPLIVIAHGRNGDPSQLDDLSRDWAAAGFVVAIPRLPRVNVDDDGRALIADSAEYPADISFVITEVLARGGLSSSGRLRARVDPEHIGVAGVSLGGLAVYGLISNTCCLDTRIDAAILMAAVRHPYPSGAYRRQRVPALLVHGDADIGYGYSRDAYVDFGPPKWFITLRKGEHGPPFDDEVSDHDELVFATTIDFWRRYLLGEHAAGRAIIATVQASHRSATLQRDVG